MSFRRPFTRPLSTMPFAPQVITISVFTYIADSLISVRSLADLGGTHSSTDVVQNILKILSAKRVNW